VGKEIRTVSLCYWRRLDGGGFAVPKVDCGAWLAALEESKMSEVAG